LSRFQIVCIEKAVTAFFWKPQSGMLKEWLSLTINRSYKHHLDLNSNRIVGMDAEPAIDCSKNNILSVFKHTGLVSDPPSPTT